MFTSSLMLQPMGVPAHDPTTNSSSCTSISFRAE